MNLNYTVTDNDSTNLKELLKEKLQISNRLLIKLKSLNKIFINSTPVSINENVHPGDNIQILFDYDETSDNIIATKIDLDIIYEDDAYLVINKPANMPVHPSMEHYTDSLSNGVKYYFVLNNLNKKIRPVNRIDRNTSGIVIFAKNEYVQESLIKQMKQNIFQKEYIAICDGIFDKKQGTINQPIARKENSIIERCVSENGKYAITHYKVLKEFENYSIVSCKLETGRTHQIRVHMSYIGHPLIGDTLYSTPSNLIGRQALHAYKVSFIHPFTRQTVSYIADIPDDLKKLCI